MLLAGGQAVDEQGCDERRVDADPAGLREVPNAQSQDARRVEHDADHEDARDALEAVPVPQHEEAGEHQPERHLESQRERPLQFHVSIYITRSI
jgi:hypothetical protein